MKKLFTICFLLTIISLNNFGQETLSKDSFQKYLNEQYKLYSAIDSKKSENHPKKLAMLNEILNKFLEIPEKDQNSMPDIKSWIYYDLACHEALTNQKAKALNSLETSVNSGYRNYLHMESDSDLNSLHSDPRFQSIILKLQEKYNYINILRNAAEYTKEDRSKLPEWRYQKADAPNLLRVREYFNLDSIVQGKDEIEQITTLLKWIHDEIPHDGNHNAKCARNAISLYKYSKENKQGINCRMLAITLNECLLSLGFKSRFVTCLPKDRNDFDCHVINTVYVKTLNKWIYIDPTQNAYVKDENGNFLSIPEVRKRLIENKPLVLNDDANWNNKVKATTKEYLGNYMAKNLYRFQCSLTSKYQGDQGEKVYLYSSAHDKNEIIENDYISFDDSYFWEE